MSDVENHESDNEKETKEITASEEASLTADTEQPKPKVPSLLDLNPFSIGDDDKSSVCSKDKNGEQQMETEEPDNSEIPFKLKKRHLFTAFRLHYSLNSVLIQPFNPELFSSPTVQLWLGRAKEFSIRHSWNGSSAGMLSYKNYNEAENALKGLKLALSGKNDELEIRHSSIKPDSPYRYPHDEVNFLLKDYIEQPLISRVLVLENIPEETTEEEVLEFFPEAKTVILLNHDPEFKGLGFVEFFANHKLRDAINNYKKEGKEFVSAIEIKGEEVTLSKFVSRYNQAISWLRSHPPKAIEADFDDDKRKETCETLKSYLEDRNHILNSEDSSVEKNIELYWRLSEKMHVLVKELMHDTERRRTEGKKFPETKEMKVNPLCVLGPQDEEDEEITAATGKVPSLLDLNTGGQSLLGKRSGGSLLGAPSAKILASDGGDDNWSSQMSSSDGPVPLMDICSTQSMLNQSIYNVQSGQGSMPQNLQSLASTINKATEILQLAGSDPMNVLTGPLESTRYCKIPLPMKKPLVSRSSSVKERLYITAYPRKFDDHILEDILCRFGGLIDAYFSKGSNYGYAKFSDRSAAEKVVLVLNEQVVAGSRLHIRKADTPGEGYRASHSHSSRSRSSRY